jgi:hypothetical protein
MKQRKTLKKGKKKGGGLFDYFFKKEGDGRDRSSYPKSQNSEYEEALRKQQELQKTPNAPPALPPPPPPLPPSPPPPLPDSPPPSRTPSPQQDLKPTVNPLWLPKSSGTQSNDPRIKFYGVQRHTTKQGSGRKRKTRRRKTRHRKSNRRR